MWKSLKNSKPEERVRVKIKHQMNGYGAPEMNDNGWQSTGFLNNDRWTINKVENLTFKSEPTHWDYIK